MTILGGRTQQLDIICSVTGFTSDLLSFIVVEHIRFFHGAIQLRHEIEAAKCDRQWVSPGNKNLLVALMLTL